MQRYNLDTALDLMDTINRVKEQRNQEARAPAPSIIKLLEYSEVIEMLENSLAFELRRLKRLQQAS